MKFNQRKNNRLPNYDYSQNGMYFITICTKDKLELFGKVINGTMILNDLGEIILKILGDIDNCFEGIFLGEHTIMPNHVHLIVEINNNVGTGLAPVQNKGQTQGLSLHNFGLLSKVIQIIKSKSAVEYIKLKKSRNETYPAKIWQRSFYDHIIRNNESLNKIREYIQINSKMWERDRNNTENIWM